MRFSATARTRYDYMHGFDGCEAGRQLTVHAQRVGGRWMAVEIPTRDRPRRPLARRQPRRLGLQQRLRQQLRQRVRLGLGLRLRPERRSLAVDALASAERAPGLPGRSHVRPALAAAHAAAPRRRTADALREGASSRGRASPTPVPNRSSSHSSRVNPCHLSLVQAVWSFSSLASRLRPPPEQGGAPGCRGSMPICRAFPGHNELGSAAQRRRRGALWCCSRQQKSPFSGDLFSTEAL